MRWVLRYPSRFLQEQSDLDQLAKDVEWLVAHTWKIKPDLTIEVDIDLQIHGKPYALKLTYPPLFPDTPPYIGPRDQTELLSMHQYGPGGSLCLEWRADNWDRRITGADMVRSAHRLISLETHPEEPQIVPSMHQLTEGQILRGSEHRLIITPHLLTMLASIPNNSNCKLEQRTIFNIPTAVAFISAIEVEGQMTKIGDLPSGISSRFSLLGWTEEGNILKSNTFDLSFRSSSVEDLTQWIAQAGLNPNDALIKDQTTGQLKSQFILLVSHDLKEMKALAINAGEPPSLQSYEVIFPSTAQRLPTASTNLATVRFGIVGVGSVGSKVAISLARSGARRFLLVDDDFLTPNNICRHELHWGSVGMHKVNAVRDMLKLIAPDMDIQARAHRVAGQESALGAAAALADLGRCDVLIDTTANADVFIRLAAVAKTERRPLCWGEIFAGGIGGLIARARPDCDPTPLVVRNCILAYLETLPPAPFQKAAGYDVDESEPLVAYDSDVTHIASALTRLILDTVLSQQEKIFPHSAYLIGLRQAWIFTEPFDTRPIPLKSEDAGWVEESDSSEIADREKAMREINTMIERIPDAGAGSSS